MYVENYELFTFTKIGQGASKKSFPPCYYHSRLMQRYFKASALHILYIISRISRATDLQIYSENFSDGFHVVSPWFPMVSYGSPWLSLVIFGYTWLSLVIFGYTWLSLVIFGYTWLSLVIPGYTWLSTIQIYMKSFAHLQFFFPSSSEIFCSRGQIK